MKVALTAHWVKQKQRVLLQTQVMETDKQEETPEGVKEHMQDKHIVLQGIRCGYSNSWRRNSSGWRGSGHTMASFKSEVVQQTYFYFDFKLECFRDVEDTCNQFI